MLLMSLLLPATMIGFGGYFKKSAPKRINDVFGYRTSRSMKNRDTWEFAHHYCGKLWLRIGIILAPVSIVAMLFCYGRDIDFVGFCGMTVVLLQVAVMIISIFPVESALKRTFDDFGMRRK